MSRQAYACRISSETFDVIRSENPGFDLEQTKAWLEKHGSGYFIRDESSRAFDCSYMADVVFHEIYAFENGDQDVIFRKIIRLD